VWCSSIVFFPVFFCHPSNPVYPPSCTIDCLPKHTVNCDLTQSFPTLGAEFSLRLACTSRVLYGSPFTSAVPSPIGPLPSVPPPPHPSSYMEVLNREESPTRAGSKAVEPTGNFFSWRRRQCFPSFFFHTFIFCARTERRPLWSCLRRVLSSSSVSLRRIPDQRLSCRLVLVFPETALLSSPN